MGQASQFLYSSLPFSRKDAVRRRAVCVRGCSLQVRHRTDSSASSCALTLCPLKRFNLVLLLRESCLEIFALLFNLAVFFKELIEQHRVHRFVAHSVDVALFRRAPPGGNSPRPLPRQSIQIAPCSTIRSMSVRALESTPGQLY